MFATSIRTARRKVSPAFALAAIGVTAVSLGASSAGATSVPPTGDGETVVLDQGDLSQAVDLNTRPAVGSAATNTTVSTTAGTLSLTGEAAQTVDIDVLTTVVESGEITAADDTGVTMRRRVESYDVVDSSSAPGVGESFASDEELGELVGVELDYLFDADNRLQDVVPADGVELSPAQSAAVGEIVADGIDKADLPDEEVGVGAQWTATLPGADAVGTYTLVSLVDGQYTVDVTLAGDASSFFDAELPDGFDAATGSIEGTGTLVGNVDEPLVRSTELEFSMNVTLTGANGEMTMDLTMTESEVSTAA